MAPLTIDAPGQYQMTAEDYHADCCPAPSLSSSIANRLLTYSPLHAMWGHPRLSPDYRREESDRFDLGTIAHAYLLQGETDFSIVDAPDWRRKDAQVAKLEARLAGKTPILREQWERVLEMAEAAGPQLDALEDRPRPFTAGKPEQTLIWREGDVWCRARLDWLHDDHRTIDDYKTSDLGNPDVWTRALLFRNGYDVQAAWYTRGVKAVFGIEAAFRFVVQETYKPYALSVIALGPDAMALAERKVEHAIRVWGECLTTNRWPGYPVRTCWAEAPPWAEAQWVEREGRDWQPPTQEAIDDGRPLVDQLWGPER